MANKKSEHDSMARAGQCPLSIPILPGDLRAFKGSAAASACRVRVLPHEYVFGCFLALTWLRLLFQVGAERLPSVAFLVYLLASGGMILWAGRRPTPWRWRLRLLQYPVLMGLSFYTLPSALALLQAPRVDALLPHWDKVLLGSAALAPFQFLESAVITDLMMLAYLFFFYYLIAGPAYYCLRDLPRFRQCFVGLFTIYGLGFIGYSFLPAGGPHRFLEFDAPLPHGWITHLTKPLVDGCSNGIDAFPSIHVAVSLYLLIFDRWYYRRRFWWMLAPCVALWISTIYLRYHYTVDVGAGVLLAIVGLAVAVRYERTAEARAPSPLQQ